MFRFFENLVDPFPEAAPERPPERLGPFVWHYTRPLAPWIALMAALTAAVSILEVVWHQNLVFGNYPMIAPLAGASLACSARA
jgi:hypothetical protein